MAITSIINENVINPRDLTQYNAYRGVTDFTNINQFAQYESGYQALFVLQMPFFMEQLDKKTSDNLCGSFRHMLEYEFKGLDGLPDITTDTMEITDGINTQRLINKVTYDTNVTVSMEYYEKTGGLITKFAETYLTGIKDKNSQAKTYHGLIADGTIPNPGPDKEIFTMLYVATDATMLRVERGVLLANCQLTKADTSIYNGNRNDINNKPLTIEFNCYPIMNNLVDKAARALLERMNKVSATYTGSGSHRTTQTFGENKAPIATQTLDSTEYKYGIMYTNSGIDKAVANKTALYSKIDKIEAPTTAGSVFQAALNNDDNLSSAISGNFGNNVV